MDLAASELSCRVRTNTAGGLARLLLLRDPVADVLDVVENEAAYFRARRTQAAGSQGAAACVRSDLVAGARSASLCSRREPMGQNRKGQPQAFPPCTNYGQSTESVPDNNSKLPYGWGIFT